jgi:hypothetical protein
VPFGSEKVIVPLVEKIVFDPTVTDQVAPAGSPEAQNVSG